MKKYLARGFAVDEGRCIKAKKIEAVLLDFLCNGHDSLSGKTIADIGCGSGHIAAYFSAGNQVWAADVIDQVTDTVRDNIHFLKIEHDTLPFSEEKFDIAILNHVIAHTMNKSKLLSETYRILKRGGLCYIANPNWFYPVEPYYHVPLLHYLPEYVFLKLSKYLGKNIENVYLISCLSLKKIAERAGFKVYDFTVRVINDPGKYFSEFRAPLGVRLPETASVISPTNIFILKK
jgi:ubiquinone/menaquinone biosynthesis C-methylase UbiE